MKNILVKTIILCSVLILIISFDSYSFCISRLQETWLRSYSTRVNNYYFDNDLILKNQNVKMTQDDNYYYFDIEAEILLKDEIKGIMNASPISIYSNMRIRDYMGVTNQFVTNCMQPLLYSEEDFTKERITESCSYLDISGHQLNEHTLYFGSKKIAQTHIEGTANSGFGGNITYWRTNYGNYFYFPHALKIYDGSFLGREYNGDYIPNVNEMLVSHDGVEILSQSSFLKNSVIENNIVKDAVIGCKTKIKVEKTKMDRYKYLAYGGLLYCSSYNHLSVDNTFEENLNAAFSMTGTFNIATYSNCKHSFEYTYSKDSLTHTKKCRKCEWIITENHNYGYEYDGIKENMCECGKCLKIKCHYEINDDYNKIIEKEVYPYSEIEVINYREREGYEFLYYEKYERILFTDAELNFSYSTATKSTLTKDILIATMSTPDCIINDKSIIYKCVYTPIRFTINYHTSKGYMMNNSSNMSIKTTYWDFILMKPKGDFGNEIYFDRYYSNGKRITCEKDLRNLVYTQDQVFNLEAIFDHQSYGKIENGAENEPMAGGGLKDKNGENNNNKNIENNNVKEIYPNEGFDINDFENLNNNDIYIMKILSDKKYDNKKSKKNISDENELEENNNKEIFGMSLSDYEKLLDKLGLKVATLSNAKNKKVGKGDNLLLYVYNIILNSYVLLTLFSSLLLFIIFFIIKKRKSR